ncbi:hypothetical protein SGCOL_008442 [Colletotrichum sp. CLE4]
MDSPLYFASRTGAFVENETRGRAAAIRRRDELEAEKEKLSRVLSMAREGVAVAKASQMAAAETAAEINNDYQGTPWDNRSD